MLTLHGLIDPHVHLRDPGQTQKEDFYTGTVAALAGGYTTILDMPNNKVPITTLARLEEKIAIAKQKIVCDVGFYFGSTGDNLGEFEKVKNKVMGLKLYLNETTGNLIIDKKLLEKIFIKWSQSMSLRSGILSTKNVKPILVHAEGKRVEHVINVVKSIKIPTHFCHISLASELKIIIKAKEENLPVTCGVTPHHLFLTENDIKTLGPFGKMKPALRTKKDVAFLWNNINLIDVIESDHAPHTIREKNVQTRFERGRQTQFVSPFGVPGLETTLPLLLTAVSQKRLTIEDVIRLCFENPSRIFCSSKNCDATIEVDLYKSYTIENKNLFTKCHWSPFDGWKVKGKVQRVWIRGVKVFDDGKVLIKPGFGKVLTEA
ncbi:MAG: dihydroorotase family protein [Patescibacteria group bacterium]